MKRALFERFKSRQISSLENLSEFIATRSAYIAQTSLYGYLKTRMGTQYRTYFEDEQFSRQIHFSVLRLYVSCLSDLTVYSIALVVERCGLRPENARQLARQVFESAILAGVEEHDRNMIPPDAVSSFGYRLERTDWASAGNRDQAFGGSIDDLLRFAPVVDEFKAQDGTIVKNSIRFRWRDVREQLRDRLAADEIVSDFEVSREKSPPR